MSILFYIGLGLLCLAFLSGAAEIAASTVPGLNGLVIPAYDLWRTFSPTSLVHAHIVIQRNVGQWLWDPVLKTVLTLPAWFLFGAPGMVLAWFCNPRRHFEGKGPINEDDFFLFDDLARKAREDGYGGGNDEGYSDHSLNMEFAAGDDPDKSEKAEYNDNFSLLDDLSKTIANGEYVDTDGGVQAPPPRRDND